MITLCTGDHLLYGGQDTEILHAFLLYTHPYCKNKEIET